MSRKEKNLIKYTKEMFIEEMNDMVAKTTTKFDSKSLAKLEYSIMEMAQDYLGYTFDFELDNSGKIVLL